MESMIANFLKALGFDPKQVLAMADDARIMAGRLDARLHSIEMKLDIMMQRQAGRGDFSDDDLVKIMSLPDYRGPAQRDEVGSN